MPPTNADILPIAKRAWSRAAGFPPNKEEVYPDHARAQEFDLHHGLHVVEYGCGGGSDTMSYLRRDNQVTFLDIVPGNVDATTAYVRQAGYGPEQAIGYLLAESVPIPLDAGSVDLVNCHGVLHHIPDPIPVVADFYRILKPGGLLYAMLYTETLYQHAMPTLRRIISSGRAATVEEAFAAVTDGEGAPYAVHYTESKGSALFDGVGFVVESRFVYNNGEFRTFRCRKSSPGGTP